MINENQKQEEAYWNRKENCAGYEENNFSIFTDKMAREYVFDLLDEILCDLNYVIGDLGCGPEHILPYLSPLCKKIIKIDYARNMLKEAQERNPKLTNIVYEWDDLRDLSRWYNKFDIAIATNSILPHSIVEADQMVKEIFKSLKKNGTFVAVMPSIETSNWLARLQFDSYIKEGFPEAAAIKKIHLEFQKKAFDGVLGFMRDGPDNMVQKYFYQDELRYIFKKSGFEILSLEKLCYSWEHCRKYDFGYFPEEENIYDWLIIARK